MGQIVSINCPATSIESRIRGIEVDQHTESYAAEGQSVAMLFEDIGIDELETGVMRLEDGSYEVTNLQISQRESRWWRFSE